MLRLILFFVAVAFISWGLSYLADEPGRILVDWQGYEVQISVFHAVIAFVVLLALVILLWSLVRRLLESPAAISDFFRRRQQKRGLDALSTGIMAVGAGDRTLATRYAAQARRALPNEPLTDLLRAQAAQLSGDHATARRIYEAMLASPDTEPMALRGLFLEARTAEQHTAARQFAERAVKLNRKLEWAVDAMFEYQCQDRDWEGALDSLSLARRYGHVEKAVADRRRAVLLTAQAQAAEETDTDKALSLAREAHKLAPDLVPAAEIAGRLMAAHGHTAKAAKLIAQTWKRTPHPDLALAYAYARPGDSPKDRLKRVKHLAGMAPHNIEAPVAVANAAIEAHDWDAARLALQPLMESNQTQRVCTLMARIEGGQHGDRGRVREWLARAVHAPRDPAWTADGCISDHWEPVSPVTGELDAFEWKVPVEAVERTKTDLLIEQLMPTAIGADAAASAPDSGTEIAHAPGRQPVAEAVVITDDTERPEAETPPAGTATEISPPAKVAGSEQAPSTDEQPSRGGESAAAASALAPAPKRRKRSRSKSKPAKKAEAKTAGTPATEKAAGTISASVAPRAPDDPGPDSDDSDEAHTPLARFRMSPAKGGA